MAYLLIALGGAIGSVLRYAIGGAVQSASPPGFPWGTLTVNVVGCLLIGALWHAFAGSLRENQMRALLVTGFCGGFTTFSAFSLETVNLIKSGSWPAAFLYVGLSVIAGVGGTMLALAKTTPV